MAVWTDINTVEDLKQIPQIFNTTPHADASKHYKVVHTLDVLEGAQKLGWNAVKAAGVGNNPYGYHAIKMEHPEYVTGDGDKIQMIINNSHDRTRQFSLDVGVFRLVCTNGLIVPIFELASIKKKHIGFDSMELLDQLLTTMDNASEVAPRIKVMSEIDLTDNQQDDIAIQALLSRLGEEELVKSVDLDTFLAPRRRQDRGTDLWTVYNVVQEKIIGGHFEYKNMNKKGILIDRKSREVNNFKEDLRINKDIFNIATQYIPQN